jgi:hypothetical protein
MPMNASGRARSEFARVVLWWVLAMLSGAVIGALFAIAKEGPSQILATYDRSGSWGFALMDQAGVGWWAGIGAVVGFAVVMAFVAWRIVVGVFGGFVVGLSLGALVGAALYEDPGAPVDWGLLIGLAIGALVGTVAGIAGGITWHLRHTSPRRAPVTAAGEGFDVEPDVRTPQLVRGTPHAADPRPRTGHGNVVP